jgi:hypothetical protein
MGSNHGGLGGMFTNPKYIPNYSNFKDDGEANGDEGVINMV